MRLRQNTAWWEYGPDSPAIFLNRFPGGTALTASKFDIRAGLEAPSILAVCFCCSCSVPLSVRRTAMR